MTRCFRAVEKLCIRKSLSLFKFYTSRETKENSVDTMTCKGFTIISIHLADELFRNTVAESKLINISIYSTELNLLQTKFVCGKSNLTKITKHRFGYYDSAIILLKKKIRSGKSRYLIENSGSGSRILDFKATSKSFSRFSITFSFLFLLFLFYIGRRFTG